MNIDWSKAPEDATHYLPDSPCDYECWVKPGFSWRLKDQNRWHPDTAVDYDIEHGRACSRPKVWTGTGLPPVGTVCEWKLKQEFGYVAAEVLFVSEQSIVLRRKDGFEWQELHSRCCFRPIRTQAQIEAEERESAIQEIASMIGRGNFYEDAARIYDAGYRKQPKEDA